MYVYIDTDNEALFYAIKDMIKTQIKEDLIKQVHTKFEFSNEIKINKNLIFKNFSFLTVEQLLPKYTDDDVCIPIIMPNREIIYDSDDEKYTSKNAYFNEMNNKLQIVIDHSIISPIWKAYNCRNNEDIKLSSDEYTKLTDYFSTTKSDFKEKLYIKKSANKMFKECGLTQLMNSLTEHFSTKKQKVYIKKYIINQFLASDVTDFKACNKQLKQINDLTIGSSLKTEIYGEIETFVIKKIPDMNVDVMRKWNEIAKDSFNKLEEALKFAISNITIKDREKFIKEMQSVTDLNKLSQQLEKSSDSEKELIISAIIELKTVYVSNIDANEKWITFIDNLVELKIDRSFIISIIIKLIKTRLENYQRQTKAEEKSIYFHCLSIFLQENLSKHFVYKQLLMLVQKDLKFTAMTNFTEIVSKLTENEYNNCLVIENKLLSLTKS